MFDVAQHLMNSLQNAAGRLRYAADSTSRAQTPYGTSSTDAAMAQTAREAVFTEALLAAAHARLAEIKTAAR